jgi:hypothetical protein
MAVSETSICNDALIMIGANTISSLSDNTKEARLCNEQYEKIRDQLLFGHPWNFAIKRIDLAADPSLPSGYWGHAYAHTLPSDCLRILCIESEDQAPWVVEGGKVFSDITPLNLRYIRKETDTTKFSKGFEEALAAKLAHRLAYALTQSATAAESVRTQAEELLSKAMSFDGQEGSLGQVQANDYINSRY